jgi:hypothetical protein
MPIPFTCECGKQLQAKEEFAGRRIKCPVCQRLLTIPAAAPAITVAEVKTVTVPAASPVAPAAGPIRFSCHCGKLLQADSSKIGRPLRCPGCGAMVTVPAHSEGPPLAPRTAGPVRPRADGFLEQRITPWRAGDAVRFGAWEWEARDRRSAGTFGGLLVLLLALVVGVAGLHWLNHLAQARHTEAVPEAALDWEKLSDVDLLPRDAGGLVSVPLAKFWDSKLGREARVRFPALEAQEAPNAGIPGLRPTDIERQTVVFPPLPLPTLLQGGQGLWFVTTIKPYDRRLLQKVLTGKEQVKVSSQPMAYPLANNPKAQVAFLNSRVLVVGDSVSMAWYLNQQPNPEGSSRLHAAFQEMSKDHILVAALAPVEWDPLRTMPAKQKKGPSPQKLGGGPKGPGGFKGPGGPKGPGGFKGPGGPKAGGKGGPVYGPPPKADLKKLVPPQFQPFLPLADCRLALLTVDEQQGLRFQLQLAYAPADLPKADHALNLGLKLLTSKLLAIAASQAAPQMELPQAVLSAGATVGTPTAGLGGLPGLLYQRAPHATPEGEQAAALIESLFRNLHRKKTETEIQLSLTASPEDVDRALNLLAHTVGQFHQRPPARLQKPQEQP